MHQNSDVKAPKPRWVRYVGQLFKTLIIQRRYLSIVLGAGISAAVWAGSVTYTYDDLGRVTVVAFDNGSHINYSLDPAGNRKSQVRALDSTAPSAPTGLAGVATTQTNINLTWTACVDTTGSTIVGSKVFRAGTQIGTSAGTSYSDATVVASTTYAYTVSCYDNAVPANTSAQSTPASVTTPDANPPTVPTGLAGSAPTSTTVNLTWTASTDPSGPGLAGYKIYRAGIQIGTSVSASYSDTTVVGSTGYSYTVASYDTAGSTSAQSTSVNVTTPDSIAPSVPTSLAGTAASSTIVNLTWTASTDTGGSTLAGYKIYRAGTQLATSATASYSDTTTSGTTTYSYAVAAYDHSGNTSAQSSPVSVTTPDTISPTVPGALTAIAVSPTQVNLTWTASTDAGGSGLSTYAITRNGTALASPASTATSYNDTTAAVSTTYTYVITASDHAGNHSAASTGATVTTPGLIPSSPGQPNPRGIVTATPWTESWAASTGPVAYYVLSRTGGTGTSSWTITAPTTTSSQSGGNGVTYGYTVVGCNSSNQCSAPSGVGQVTLCKGGTCP